VVRTARLAGLVRPAEARDLTWRGLTKERHTCGWHTARLAGWLTGTCTWGRRAEQEEAAARRSSSEGQVVRELRAEVSGLRRKLAAAKVVAKDAQRRGALESGANHAQTLQVRPTRA
jgi:hypothetical protein